MSVEELREKGYIVLSSRNTLSSLKSTILPLLPEGYVFLDYKYTIVGPPLFTYHRDVTSSRSSFNTRYPTYTVIHYEYDGAHLSVSPGSHLQWQPYLPITIGGNKNQTILFDCDLVHAGLEAPASVKRKATQYKIAHRDDLYLLQEVASVDIVQKGKEVHWILKPILLAVSYIFTVPIQVICRPLMQRLQTGLFGYIQDLFPLNYYNNPFIDRSD